MRRALGRIKHRLRPPSDAKGDSELRWWLEHWDPVLRQGGLFGVDTLALSGDENVAASYEGRRWQQARGELRRVLREAAIEDPDFFRGKVVLDIGSGPLGFPDACSEQAVCISVDPLAERYAQAGLLLDSAAVYLSVGAERTGLRSASVDVVVSRNNLDHVEDPRAVVEEVKRLLRPGGVLILNVDVGQRPSVTEPHVLSLERLREWLAPLRIERELVWDEAHGDDGRAVVILARRAHP